MQGQGIFSSMDGVFAQFLAQFGGGSGGGAFVARNFLLDEAVSPERAETYRAAGCVADHGTAPAWAQRHELYLRGQVFRSRPADGPPQTLDPSDPDLCGETFRALSPSSPFLVVDPNVPLLRVEELDFIARNRSFTADQFKALARAVVRGTASADQIREFDRQIAEWAAQTEMWPVFATLFDGIQEIFAPSPENDAQDWADTLRDRLGMMHLNPGERMAPIDVIVFRYPVSDVPRLKGLARGTKPLVPPSVLDSRHSVAFCPAPRGSLTGHTIDLSRQGRDPRREVLHPAFDFQAKHVFRFGTIRRPIDPAVLPEARGLHLLSVRDASGRDDYARGTDGDICGD
ncbi:MAG TPA: hypothetical protein VFE33_31765 [Thermoanaerobaculia bacterium]|nr:hypothetical protein [Thermoanaerobaculia bacterium]